VNGEDRDELIKVVKAICDQRDLRYEQRWKAMEEALRISDVASEKRLDSVNEFRAQQADLIAEFLRRDEYHAAHVTIVEKVNELTERVTKSESAAIAVQAFKGYMIGVLGLMVIIGGIAISNLLAR
jgi:hypothetical protein